MPENSALLAAIIANPAEDTPRLAYADWLDENGEPEWARFIRLQFEIEKLPPIGPKASKAKKEEEALLKKHEKNWAGPIASLVQRCVFRRGFVEYVRVAVADYLTHGDRLFQLAPLREVRFVEIKNQMPALAVSPLLGKAERLAFSNTIMDQLHYDGRLEALLASPYLATVRGLNLSMSSLTDADVERVANCPHLGALTHLDLSTNSIRTPGLRAIANSDRLPKLSSLTIHGNPQVNVDGVRAIVDSPLAERLEQLTLAFQVFRDEGVKLLASASRLTHLRMLDLSHNDLTDAGANALAAAPNLAGLQRLNLRGHRKTIGKDARTRLQKRFGKDVCVF